MIFYLPCLPEPALSLSKGAGFSSFYPVKHDLIGHLLF